MRRAVRCLTALTQVSPGLTPEELLHYINWMPVCPSSDKLAA
jgi:hypothetical protein